MLVILAIASVRFFYIKHVFLLLHFPHTRKSFKAVNLYKYYITSGVIGFISCDSIKRNPSYFIKLKYSFLTMDWGLLILLIDAVSDIEKPNKAYSRQLNLKCYQILCDSLIKLNETYRATYKEVYKSIFREENAHFDFNPETPLTELSLFFATKIKNKMSWILPKDGKQNSIQILNKAIFEGALLCKGQIDSIDQIYCDETHNFSWYCNEVIYNKTVYIYSFMYFFATDDEEGEKAENVGKALLLANDMYLNRQLLDDMNDIEIDTHDGIYAGPSYLLCSGFKIHSDNSLEKEIINHFRKKLVNNYEVEKNAEQFKNHICKTPSKSVLAIFASPIPSGIIQIIEDENRYRIHYYQYSYFVQEHPKESRLSALFYYRCGKSLKKAKLLINRHYSKNNDN